MFCDPSFEAIRSTNNVLGPGPNLNAAITVDNDMVASLLLFPSTVRSVAAETLYNTNNFQKITGDSYKVRHTNSKSEWQLHSPRVSRHPYQRQYVHKGSLARAANVVSSLRSVQRPTLGGLTRAADTTSLLLGDLDAASFQCLRPTSTHSDHLRTVAPVPATNTSTGQLLVPPVQINQALVIPAGLVGQSQILTRSSDQLSLGTQLANPASIVQMGSSFRPTHTHCRWTRHRCPT
ncbi:hypothetical protein BJ742DRAFT_556170 [Cladochytrium replicatum]|nr:hypothetical protein BJ742DRAFT_556170 [Cladochytrium replicatum]